MNPYENGDAIITSCGQVFLIAENIENDRVTPILIRLKENGLQTNIAHSFTDMNNLKAWLQQQYTIDKRLPYNKWTNRIADIKDSDDARPTASVLPVKDNMPLEEMGFSNRTYTVLKRAGINDKNQLEQKTEEEVAKIRNIGKMSLKEILTKLQEFK